MKEERGRKGMRGRQSERARERESTGSFILRDFLKAGILGEDINRIFISFSGVPFQGHGHY